MPTIVLTLIRPDWGCVGQYNVCIICLELSIGWCLETLPQTASSRTASEANHAKSDAGGVGLCLAFRVRLDGEIAAPPPLGDDAELEAGANRPYRTTDARLRPDPACSSGRVFNLQPRFKRLDAYGICSNLARSGDCAGVFRAKE